MKLISYALEQEMILIESKRDNIKEARQILERALCEQMQLLTISLFSSELLNRGSLKAKDLSEMKEICMSLFPNAKLDTNEDIMNFVAEGIYNKRWPHITLVDVKNVEIRILGKSVWLWNTIEINEQLAILGSDYRLFFAGSMQLVGSYIKELLGYEQKIESFDCRYILGEIGPISISYGGPIFDFVSEIVTSPYLLNDSPGFAIRDTAVIRRKVLREQNAGELEFSLVVVHEVAHTLQYSFNKESSFIKANWNLYLKRDICRYLKKPHCLKEIDKTFTRPDVSFYKEMFLELTENLVPSFADYTKMLPTLLTSNIITQDASGNYLCTSYQEGQPWDVF